MLVTCLVSMFLIMFALYSCQRYGVAIGIGESNPIVAWTEIALLLVASITVIFMIIHVWTGNRRDIRQRPRFSY